MTTYRSVIPVQEEPDTRLDRVIEATLIVTLTFMPLAFGAVHAWSEQVVVVLAAGLGMLFGIKLILSPQVRFVWSWAYLPVAIFLLMAAAQLVPLPTFLVDILSPHTASLRTELLGDLPDSERLLSSMTLSLNPHATRHDLRLAMAMATVFVVVVNLYREPGRIKRLLTAIAAIGGGVALLALAQDLAGNGKIYWFVPCYDLAHSGPFINHSHYGQFRNRSRGAALSLLLMHMYESFAGRSITPAGVTEYLASPKARAIRLLLAMVVLGIATVFVSLTRGAMISMLVAAGFTMLMFSRRQSLRGPGWTIALLTLGAFVCILYVGFDEVYDRLATFQSLHQVEGNRWQIVKDIALAWTRFPVFGVGLGAHASVYPMFDSSTIAAWATHAENEYAQVVEEMGLAGLLTLVLLGVAVWASYARSVSVPSSPIRSTAYGLGFGLLAIQVHSLVDFGQHLPANAMLSTIFCGLLIAMAHGGERVPEHPSGRTRRPAVAVVRAGVAALAAGVFAWSILGANRASTAESHWNKAIAAESHIEALQWQASEQAYDYLFTHATAAVEAEPDNIQYRHWLSAYQWLSLTPYTDPNTGMLRAEALPWARQIVEDLHAARPLCPTFGATYCLAGEIEKFVLADPNGARHIRAGYRLAPCDSTACFVAARCDAEEGRADEAFAKLSRAVQLDARLFRRAIAMCIDDLGRGDLALSLASDDPIRLAQVGDALAISSTVAPVSLAAVTPFDANDLHDLVGQAETMAFEQLMHRCEQSDAPASAHASLASYYRRGGDVEAAIRQYRRALMKDYDQVGWHYALAQLLAGENHTDEAIREARICLRLRSDHAAAKRLIEQLSIRPRMEARPLSAGR